MTTYLLDTNVFIDAQRYYGFDFCPAFWDWIDIRSQDGTVASIRHVAIELEEVEDQVSQWSKDRTDGFFRSAGIEIMRTDRAVSKWISNQNYTQDAIEGFLSVADSRLVSYALAYVRTIVTNEKSAKGSKKSIKIPDVCGGLGIECINPFEMLQREKAMFVLSPNSK